MSVLQRILPPDGRPVHPPTRPDGAPFRFEMIFAAGGWRAYADHASELVAHLIGDTVSDHERLSERLSYLAAVQVRLQASLANSEQLRRCTEEDQQVLLNAGHQPPTVATWSAPVPLVLLTVFYAPIGRLRRPTAVGDGEVLWLDPTSDWSLLASLHRAGIITVAAHSRESDG